MNKPLLSVAVLPVLFSAAHAYEEWSLPNLTAPTVLEAPALEVRIQHQFWGRINGPDMFPRFFGMGDGAGVSMGLRGSVWKTLQVYGAYDNYQLSSNTRQEFSAGTSYAIAVPLLFARVQADGQVFSYAPPGAAEGVRRDGQLVRISLQNEPFFDRARFLAEGGYDFERQRFGLGLGLDMGITGMFDVFGEVFPLVDKGDIALGGGAVPANTPFSFGVRITTAGHQFLLFAGNSSETGFRHLMRGTPDNLMRFGFVLKRLFSFGS
jgi:hypothetical protein